MLFRCPAFLLKLFQLQAKFFGAALGRNNRCFAHAARSYRPRGTALDADTNTQRVPASAGATLCRHFPPPLSPAAGAAFERRFVADNRAAAARHAPSLFAHALLMHSHTCGAPARTRLPPSPLVTAFGHNVISFGCLIAGAAWGQALEQDYSSYMDDICRLLSGKLPLAFARGRTSHPKRHLERVISAMKCAHSALLGVGKQQCPTTKATPCLPSRQV